MASFRNAHCLLLAATACFSASLSHAAASCVENVTMAILHSNGNVYFTTDQTCSTTWCQVDWGTAEKNKNALAALLMAKMGDLSMEFYWPNIQACSDKNAVYSSPAYMMLK